MTATTVTETPLSEASAEWYAWREQVADKPWEAGLGWAVTMEQMMWRSEKEVRCCECGEPGAIVKTSSYFHSVKRYYLCDSCDAHFEGSVGGNTYTVLGQTGKHEANVASLCNRREAQRIARNHESAARVRVNAA